MDKLLDLAGKGWKTYAAAGVLILLGVIQISQGHADTGLQSITTGLGLLGLRHAVAQL